MHKILLILGLILMIGVPARAQNVPVQDEKDRVLGKEEAPITIFEYASFTCPHCAAFDQRTLPKVKEMWIDTGKAKLIFRDFPLDETALTASVVTHCMPAERFYPMIDVLYQNQGIWARADDPVGSLKHFAALGGASTAQIDACLQDQQLANFIVGERFTAHQSYGVNSTPTFFINGKMIEGDVSYDTFAKALENAQPKS
ncbi:MAG TPA: DsbA family protein [Stellaceae bacterium]|nr:DsbA family protein [Stellaceae bacterium]